VAVGRPLRVELVGRADAGESSQQFEWPSALAERLVVTHLELKRRMEPVMVEAVERPVQAEQLAPGTDWVEQVSARAPVDGHPA
jgi:hypothetical protein